jgi:hypothetical protein
MVSLLEDQAVPENIPGAGPWLTISIGGVWESLYVG